MYSWSSFLSSLWIMRCRFMLHHYWYFFMIQYVKTHYFIFNPIINSFATPIHLPYQCVSDVYHQPCYFFWIIALLQFHWVHLMWDFCYIFYCTSIFHFFASLCMVEHFDHVFGWQVCCSGHGKNGSLCVLQQSIRPELITEVHRGCFI